MTILVGLLILIVVLFFIRLFSDIFLGIAGIAFIIGLGWIGIAMLNDGHLAGLIPLGIAALILFSS